MKNFIDMIGNNINEVFNNTSSTMVLGIGIGWFVGIGIYKLFYI